MNLNYTIIEQGNVQVKNIVLLVKNEDMHLLDINHKRVICNTEFGFQKSSSGNLHIRISEQYLPLSLGTLIELQEYDQSEWSVYFTDEFGSFLLVKNSALENTEVQQ